MDGNIAILGAVPPALVILAEVLNPVSEDIINRQVINGKAKQIARRVGNTQIDEINFDKDVENIANLVASTAGGAVEVAALIPTWIGMTAGLTSILTELEPNYYVIIFSLWTLVWAIIGIKFFSTIDYEAVSSFVSSSPFNRLTGAQALSVMIVMVNLAVIAAIVFTWWLTHTQPQPLPEGAPLR